MADPRRPGLTFKIEFESEEKHDEWIHQKFLADELSRIWTDDSIEANTTVVTVRADGRHEVRKYQLSWNLCTKALETADELARGYHRDGSGRYPKRVLMLTTSKERREGRKASTY
jgi:hypothetical protein